MTTTKINQKEYLKKYLSSNINDEKKQKKKKKSKSKSTVKIIDDDIDLSKIESKDDDIDIFQTGEDAPQIVGVIDDRPPELQALDYKNSNKWKAVNNDNFSNMLNTQTPINVMSKRDDTSSRNKNKKIKESKNSSTYSANDDRRKNNFKSTDLSPRRQVSKTGFPPVRRKNSNDDDLSPERYTSRKDTDDDLSPRRIKKKRGSDDLSPTRNKSRRDSDGDFSPKRRRNRKNQDYDLSPYRSKQHQKSEDTSSRDKSRNDFSPKRTNKASDDDLSPKRYKGRRNIDRDSNSKQSSTRKYSDDDLSPKRYHSKGYSPKRSKKSRFDAPYQRRSTSHDNSPKRPSPHNNRNEPSSSRNRRSKSASFDLSPLRKSSNKAERHHNRRNNYSRNTPSPPRRIKIKQEDSPPPSHSKMMKTLDGKTAGLSDAKALCIENAKFKERERKLFEKMTDEMSGRNADVVMRDRATGKRRNFAEESEKQRKKDEKEKAKKAIYDRWGAGLKQVEEHKARLDEVSHEMNKPLARYSNDEDLDDYLKKQERDGDPMLEYIRQKEREKNKKQGIPEMPQYKGSFPDNRFNIRPGYRWDGVDRSNGFEKKWFETISKKKAVEEEAYRYSTEDM